MKGNFLTLVIQRENEFALRDPTELLSGRQVAGMLFHEFDTDENEGALATEPELRLVESKGNNVAKMLAEMDDINLQLSRRPCAISDETRECLSTRQRRVLSWKNCIESTKRTFRRKFTRAATAFDPRSARS